MSDDGIRWRLDIIIALLLLVLGILLSPVLPLIVIVGPLLLLLVSPVLIWSLMEATDE